MTDKEKNILNAAEVSTKVIAKKTKQTKKKEKCEYNTFIKGMNPDL